MMTHPLLPKLRELRLSGMLDSLEERAQTARDEHLAPIEFLALLLDDEIDRRTRARMERRQREAGFESAKLLSQFDFAAIPTLSKRLVLEMATCQFVGAHENWLLHGPTGVGKSHLATAIGYEAIRRGYRTLACSTHGLVADLLAARADGTYARRLHRLVHTDLLILDDFGLRPVSSQGAEDLYELIHRRYEKGSILLTSNRAPSEWAEVFGDSLLASAAVDRLTHHAQITCMTGESYRQRQRQESARKSRSSDGLPESSRDASRKE